MVTLLNEFEKPEWVKYPKEYIDLIKKNNCIFITWYLMDRQQVLIRYQGLKKRYPDRELFPFARHDTSDDIACWEKDKPGKVIIIHDLASTGYENKREFDSFNDWLLFTSTFSD